MSLIFIWKCKGPIIVKIILKKKEKVERLTLSDIKVYYKAIIIKKVWNWCKD